jgi:hypothetical protein
VIPATDDKRKHHHNPDTRGDQGVEKKMSITEFRTNAKRARERRNLYARINRLPSSTVREELIAIAQRHEFGES